VSKYLETRTRLNERVTEVYKKIADHKRQRDEMAAKLRNVQVSLKLKINMECFICKMAVKLLVLTLLCRALSS
jgi:uncharacterized coiled-coil DUF342 family protein